MEAANIKRNRVDGRVRAEGVVALVLFPLLCLLMISGVISAAARMPLTSVGLLICAITVVFSLHLAETGKGFLGGTKERENRFWGMAMNTMLGIFFFSPDSPFCFGLAYPVEAVFIILSSGMFVYTYDRYKDGRQRARELLKLGTVYQLDEARAEDAGKLLEDVNECLRMLSYSVPLLKALPAHRRRIIAAQQKVVRLLREADKLALNFVMSNVNMKNLFHRLKDSDIMVGRVRLTGDNGLFRSQLTNLLCTSKKAVQHVDWEMGENGDEDRNDLETLGGRLDDLGVRPKARIIAAMQEIRLTSDSYYEEMVGNLILSTFNRRLTKLKMLLDARCSVNCFHKLVYRDIDSRMRRERILAHIDEQGQVVQRQRKAHAQVVALSAHRSSKSSGREEKKRAGHRKILSDIDDTLFSSGGRFPAGVDTSYPRHTIYPGALQILKELDLGVAGEWMPGRPGNLTFLSARPHVYKDVLGKKANNDLEKGTPLGWNLIIE